MKPSAVLGADIHLREDVPLCRGDNYWDAQWKKMEFINELCREHGDIPFIVAGDLFDKWKPSPRLIRKAIETLPTNTACIPGQHDLPSHSLDLFNKSGMGVLEASGTVTILPFKGDKKIPLVMGINMFGFSWGEELTPINKVKGLKSIAVVHMLIYDKVKLWAGADIPSGHSIMKKLEGFDLILTGDNHKPFVNRTDKQLLVNSGSMMRMTASQIDHKPRVYLWSKETNTVEAVYLPIQQDVITREHIELQKERDDRLDIFINKLNDNFKIEHSFEGNLKEYFSKNKTSIEVQNLIWGVVENGV